MKRIIAELSETEASGIIEAQEPRGLFWHMGKNGGFVGIDNRTGDAWTEDFGDMDAMMCWLNGDDMCMERGVTTCQAN